ncbi:MAG: hypothetical protein WCS69_10890 [Ignavibacteriaceae bacterium]
MIVFVVIFFINPLLKANAKVAGISSGKLSYTASNQLLFVLLAQTDLAYKNEVTCSGYFAAFKISLLMCSTNYFGEKNELVQKS